MQTETTTYTGSGERVHTAVASDTDGRVYFRLSTDTENGWSTAAAYISTSDARHLAEVLQRAADDA